jgi:hypothetical protein
MDAPLARALLGKRLDDEIAVPIAGRPRYTIAAIRDESGTSASKTAGAAKTAAAVSRRR